MVFNTVIHAFLQSTLIEIENFYLVDTRTRGGEREREGTGKEDISSPTPAMSCMYNFTIPVHRKAVLILGCLSPESCGVAEH